MRRVTMKSHADGQWFVLSTDDSHFWASPALFPSIHVSDAVLFSGKTCLPSSLSRVMKNCHSDKFKTDCPSLQEHEHCAATPREKLCEGYDIGEGRVLVTPWSLCIGVQYTLSNVKKWLHCVFTCDHSSSKPAAGQSGRIENYFKACDTAKEMYWGQVKQGFRFRKPNLGKRFTYQYRASRSIQILDLKSFAVSHYTCQPTTNYLFGEQRVEALICSFQEASAGICKCASLFVIHDITGWAYLITNGADNFEHRMPINFSLQSLPVCDCLWYKDRLLLIC